MLHRTLFMLWCVAVTTLFTYTLNNGGLPLGFDHGAYRHFVHVLVETGDIRKVPTYLQAQFEPFSGTFFYTLSSGIPERWLFSWGYSILYVLISISLFLLGKKSGKYTVGSYLGLFIFIFSILQYGNFWWAFGKQMFATFFLILLMRYYKKTSISIIFLAACVSLHRLTGFIAIIFVMLSLLNGKKYHKGNILLWGLLISITTYIPTFTHQVLPFISSKIHNYVFLSGNYGTGFPDILFWTYQLPLFVFTVFAFKKSKKLNQISKNDTHVILLFVIIGMVIFNCVAHTRLESFMDLFLMIFIIKNYTDINKILLIGFLILHTSMWFSFVSKWHTPFIDKQENTIIRQITEKIPSNVTLVTLTGAYMSMMTGYTNNEIYSTYQGLGNTVFHKNELNKMRFDKLILCKNLALLPNDVFVYVGAREKFTSTYENSCLKTSKIWNNNAKLLHYSEVK